ncbi:MAG: beta-L-arabinofuranosidase domain-containing protein, partial [Planctomycetota bacterium]
MKYICTFKAFPDNKQIHMACAFAICLLIFAVAVQAASEGLIQPSVQPFPLGDVRLLDGPFKHAQGLNEKVLLRYEPDRFLAWFRKEAGLKPKAEVYGSWESQQIAGHSLGHYLSACSLMYQATGKEVFKQRVDYIVNELALCQQANGNGYVGAIPNGKQIFEKIAQGNITVERFNLNGSWVPFYSLHKLYAGLRDAWRLCGNAQALEVERKLGDWVGDVIENLSEEQMQKILYCEHGGMNEVLADLAVDTSNEKYLTLAKRFHHKEVLDPMIAQQDRLEGYHANTQIPKVTGLASVYEQTGDESFKTGAEFFWDRVVNNHSYITGGNCLEEHFGEPDKLNDRLVGDTTETCNVYNMLKLTSHLFCWQPRPEVADFYERALYNHILASQHPVDGRVIYNLPIGMGVYKQYQDPYAFTCCVGTGMENHAKYGAYIYFHSTDALYVNLFIASRLNWKETGVIVTQETDYPDSDTTRLILSGLNEPKGFRVFVRYPYWAVNGCELMVNGNPHSVDEKPSSFIELEQLWKNGDEIMVRFPMSLRTESMPDNPDRRGILYGPVVLAGDLGPVDAQDRNEPDFVPVLVTGNNPIDSWIKKEEGQTNTFILNNAGRPRDVTLRPFNKLYDRTHTVYWDFYNPQQWTEQKALYQAKLEQQQKLESRTIDFIQPGQQQPEIDHDFAGENTEAGTGPLGRKWRHATDGGWFAYDINVDAQGPLELAVTYWGEDAGNRI